MFLYFVGPREQLNQDTAFLDSSQIYGQNICDGDSLREFNAGRLNMTLPEHPRYTAGGVKPPPESEKYIVSRVF